MGLTASTAGSSAEFRINGLSNDIPRDFAGGYQGAMSAATFTFLKPCARALRSNIDEATPNCEAC